MPREVVSLWGELWSQPDRGAAHFRDMVVEVQKKLGYMGLKNLLADDLVAPPLAGKRQRLENWVHKGYFAPASSMANDAAYREIRRMRRILDNKEGQDGQ